MDPGTTAATSELLKGVARGRHARLRTLRLAVRRSIESVRNAQVVLDRTTQMWDRLAEDCEFLRIAVYLFPRLPRDLLKLYERVSYLLDQRGISTEDAYLLVSLKKLEHDLTRNIVLVIRYALLGTLPRVMPAFYDLHSEVGYDPRPWQKVIDRFDEPSHITRPVPWRDEPG